MIEKYKNKILLYKIIDIKYEVFNLVHDNIFAFTK
jgi:hypothetical protein